MTENKKRFLPLLLLGDEQESMVDRYLERGRMYVLDDGEVRMSHGDGSHDSPTGW